MSHIISRQLWGVVDLDTREGRIFCQQDWKYNWVLYRPGIPAWTLVEQRQFHNSLDRQIWGLWSNRIRLRVAGANDFARRFAAGGVPINFDVRWVTHNSQWHVTVRKMPAGSDPTTYISNVDFARQRINLDTADLAAYSATNAAGGTNPRFFTSQHEFGHTLGAPDEYNPGSPHLLDTTSIMNVGSQIRPRHLRFVMDTLNRMLPGAAFSAPAVI